RAGDGVGAGIEALGTPRQDQQEDRAAEDVLARRRDHGHCTGDHSKRFPTEQNMENLLETGWQQLDEGKLDEARKTAEAALEADRDSPDAYTLRGAVAGAEGDLEAAYAAWERAMALDPEMVEPRLLCAELCALEGDSERARELCDEALDIAEEEEDYL